MNFQGVLPQRLTCQCNKLPFLQDIQYIFKWWVSIVMLVFGGVFFLDFDRVENRGLPRTRDRGMVLSREVEDRQRMAALEQAQ